MDQARTRKREITRILEALLFTMNEPLSLEKMKEIVAVDYPTSSSELRTFLKELNESYRANDHAFQIEEIGEGFVLRTLKEMHPYLERLHHDKRGEKLSRSAATVLALIAYKEPITRAEIEKIRGVDSSGILHSLLERELVEIVGKLEVPGRPSQYGITKKFLVHFGLKNKEDLQSFLSARIK